jgi:hypothetical protein
MSTGIDPLPDFTNFQYVIVIPPNRPKGRGWEKLKECERRLALYRWAEHLNAPPKGTHVLGKPPNKVFLDDCLSAFLMALEAALEFTGNSLERSRVIPKHGFGSWLRKQREHDCQMRGLRTLRHLTAHVEIKPVRLGVTVIVPARSMAVIAGRPEVPEPPPAEEGIAHRWGLPELTRADLKKLDSPALDFDDLRKYHKALQASQKSNSLTLPQLPRNLKDLRAWNKIVFDQAGRILEHGLRQTQAILLEAEKLL